MKSRAKSLLIFCCLFLSFVVQVDAYQAHADHSINGMSHTVWHIPYVRNNILETIFSNGAESADDINHKIYYLSYKPYNRKFRKGTKSKKQIPADAISTNHGSW